MTVQTTTAAPAVKSTASGAPSTPAPATLFPVKSLPPADDFGDEGELVTFEGLNDGKELANFNEAIQQADAHLVKAGNQGRARIRMEVLVEASGVIRIFKVKLKLDLPELSSSSASIKAASRDGQLRLIGEEAQRRIDDQKREQAKQNAKANAKKGKEIADELIGPKAAKVEEPAGEEKPTGAGTENTVVGWPANVTRAEYKAWKDEQQAKGHTENLNPQEYKRLRDAGLVEAVKKAGADGLA